MKLKTLLFILIITILSINDSVSQIIQIVDIAKTDGSNIKFETKLAPFKGKYIFPDDSKTFIKGDLNGIKTKLPKSEIKEIELKDGSKYIVLPSTNYGSTDYFIGFYLSQGSTDFFKTYSYGHQTYAGSSASINKVATLSYYIVKGNNLTLLHKNNDIKKFRERCETFDSYVEKKGRIKDKELESALTFYNESCK